MSVRTLALVLLLTGTLSALLFIVPGHWNAQAAPIPLPDRLETAASIAPTPTVSHTVYIPLVEKHVWVELPIRNSGFEEAWETESSYAALKVNTDSGSIELLSTQNSILTPPGWTTWFRAGQAYDEGDGYIMWGQPEVRTVNHHFPDRMQAGLRGMELFTVWRVHDAGFLQYVDVITGSYLSLSAWAHAWSNNEGAPTLDNPDDPYWSEGAHVGFNQFSAPEGTEGLDGGDMNFTFMLGIDPTGGSNPMADSVVWGDGVHIYNAYREVPTVWTRAESSRITIFLRSFTLWRYKHNNAYWDEVKLMVCQ